jgi:hypothetical protein
VTDVRAATAEVAPDDERRDHQEDENEERDA